ncbi:MAG: YjjG family noncanonical pyrimidine nucleotidase [Saprospiraceae bacterium]
MRFKHLFFDLDHTLWDFEKNSFHAFERMFDDLQLQESLGIDFETFHSKYTIHNTYYWNLYSVGGINQTELKWRRMYETLKDFAHADLEKAKSMSATYLEFLPESKQLFPHTREILEYLKGRSYMLHILSNGFELTQHRKLKNSKIDTYFEHVITSEACGYVKPDARIFDYSISKANTSNQESIMIGDSPEADLQGALNAGMESVFVDHHAVDTEVKYTYKVNSLVELEEIF